MWKLFKKSVPAPPPEPETPIQMLEQAEKLLKIGIMQGQNNGWAAGILLKIQEARLLLESGNYAQVPNKAELLETDGCFKPFIGPSSAG